MPRPPIEFEISIKPITPIDKLIIETKSVLTSIGIISNNAREIKEIIQLNIITCLETEQ